MRYDFDSVIDRHNTGSVKWDFAGEIFGLEGILPLWVADMDFRVPPPVIAALKKAVEHGVFGYSRAMPSYYEAVRGWMSQRHGWDIRDEWVVFSPGVVPALHMLVRAFASPGDQVIVQTPVYYPFFRVIKNSGCELLDNPLRLEGGQYVMDLDDLERKLNPRARMMILCSPHNPVGRVWREDELRRLGELCLRHDIMVVSDEIHEDIVYEGFKHTPFVLASPESMSNLVVCTGASKTFNLAGLHTSNIIIPDARLRERFRATMEGCGIYGQNTLGIVATEAAYRHGEEWLEQLLRYLQGNIDFLSGYIAEKIPGLRLIQPQGTYLLWLDFRGCGISPDRLGTFVRQDARVGLEAGTIFGCKEAGFERMNIACPRSTLAAALQRIEQAVNSLRGR
ncbi:MAG: MalY/PatB family protein [Chloroflexota bacterium]